ncbi:MAG: ATP-binding protein [Balneolaceae bacterium]|nr:MAG: ATP-binding protein [Balneolaceae bacterium]
MVFNNTLGLNFKQVFPALRKPMKRSHLFRRDFGELENIFSFLGVFFSEFGIGEEHRFSVDLSVEEVFTNMVKYNTEASRDIDIEIEYDEGSLIVRLFDDQNKPFDVSAVKPVDLDAYHKAGKIGGLGIHLVHQFMDDVRHEVNGNLTTVTLIKKISS